MKSKKLIASLVGLVLVIILLFSGLATFDKSKNRCYFTTEKEQLYVEYNNDTNIYNCYIPEWNGKCIKVPLKDTRTVYVGMSRRNCDYELSTYRKAYERNLYGNHLTIYITFNVI